MSLQMAMLLALFGPLVVSLAVLALGRWPNLREGVAVVAGGGVFSLVAGTITPAVMGGERPRVDFGEMLPGVSLALEVEPLGALFALVASGLWIVTTLYAVGYMRGHNEKNQTRFFACFPLAIFGALGVAFAANVLTLFVAYELITLSTYPLVTHHGTEASKRAGRTYLGILMGTSIAFLLLATIWTHQLVGHTEFQPGGILAGKVEGPAVLALLLLYAFGTGKAALMPFHRWLPAAMVAPTPVSALLHAVAVVKAGVFTVLKVVVYVFGFDLMNESGAGIWLAAAAAATLLISSIIALFQDNLKRRLAYSTISQLAYIVLGAALANRMAAQGAGMHIAMHAMGKITLFFCAGAIYVVEHKSKVSELGGLWRRMPMTVLAFLVGSASVIGLPPLGGSWSKFYLALGAAEQGWTFMVAVYMVSSLLAIGYLMPVVVKALSPAAQATDGAPAEGDIEPQNDLRRAPLLVGAPVLTALGCVVLFFGVAPLCRLLEGMFP